MDLPEVSYMNYAEKNYTQFFVYQTYLILKYSRYSSRAVTWEL